MLRIFGIAATLLLMPVSAHAQPAAQDPPTPVREEHRASVGAGVGFLAAVDSPGGGEQFLMQFDFLYSVTNHISLGTTFQAAPAGGSSTLALSFEGRAYFPLGEGEGFLGKLAPYAGLGLGFRGYTGTTLDFLFPILFGAELDLTRRFSLTSDMRLNVTSGPDNFYYSWQLVGARFRF